MSNIQFFQFQKSEVRFVGTPEVPEWVAADVVAVLNPEVESRRRNDYLRGIPAEWRGTQKVRTPSGEQSMVTLHEPGLYWLIARSKSPLAVPFQKWVFEEVLPTIRKTGSYSLPSDTSPVESDRLLDDSGASRLARLEQQIEAGFAKIEAGQRDIWLAVSQIRRERLWNIGGFRSFKEYTLYRWGYRESYAHEIAKAGEQVATLISAGIPDEWLPSSIAQMRPLAQLDEDELLRLWHRVPEEIGSPDRLTAKSIQEVIEPRALPSESSFNKCQISAFIDPEIKRLLEEQAQIEGRSFSNMVSYCLEEGLYRIIERKGADRQ